MATIVEQTQAPNRFIQAVCNPVLEAMDAQAKSVVATKPSYDGFSPSFMLPLEEDVTEEKKPRSCVLCNCFEEPSEDYRSFVRKPKYLVSNLGGFTISNPLHVTIEQDKADLGRKIKRSMKDAKQAYSKARKAHRKAEKDHSKSDRLQAAAVQARHRIRDAKHMTDKAQREIKEVNASQERVIKWAACVEREGRDVRDYADGVRERGRNVGKDLVFCDHRFQ